MTSDPDEMGGNGVDMADPTVEMIRALTEFLVHLCPEATEDGDMDPHGRAMAPIVRDARDLALVSVFRRIARIASEDEPDLAFPFNPRPL